MFCSARRRREERRESAGERHVGLRLSFSSLTFLPLPFHLFKTPLLKVHRRIQVQQAGDQRVNFLSVDIGVHPDLRSDRVASAFQLNCTGPAFLCCFVSKHFLLAVFDLFG